MAIAQLVGRALLTPAVTALALAVAAPQMPASPPAGTAVVVGQVLDASTDLPIEGATVATSGRLGDRRLTDADGRFVFFDMPAGTVRITATRDGYAPGEVGQGWSAVNQLAPNWPIGGLAQSLLIKDGDRRDGVVVRLWKYAVITGHVVDDLGDPVVGVTVQAWPRLVVAGRPWFNGVTTYAGRTDDRGVFRIAHLLAGDYVVAVPALSITWPASLEVPKYFVTPQSVEIAAAKASMGLSNQGDVPAAGTADAVTDGPWLRSALGQREPAGEGAQARGYMTTFAPAAPSPAEASLLSLTPGGEQVADIELHLHALHAISGVVTGPDGRPRSVGLRLVSAVNGVETAAAVSDNQGQFRFSAVGEGAYRVSVVVWPPGFQSSPGAPPGYGSAGGTAADGLVSFLDLDTAPWSEAATEWTDLPVAVGAEDVSGLAVALHAGARVSGRIALVGPDTVAPAVMARIGLQLEGADGHPVVARPRGAVQVNAQGLFRSVEFPPGRYFLRAAALPAGWFLQSAMLGGRDLAVSSLDLAGGSVDGVVVTLTKTPATLTGQVRQGGHPDWTASVIAFSTDRTHWIDNGAHPRDVAALRADASGRFTFPALPAGEYFVAAVSETALAQGLVPAVLDALAHEAARVTLVDGQQRSVDLVVQVIR